MKFVSQLSTVLYLVTESFFQHQLYAYVILGAVHILRHHLKGRSFCQNMTINDIYLGGGEANNQNIAVLKGGTVVNKGGGVAQI